jgi:TDG/mug DNA glycosylase family protein
MASRVRLTEQDLLAATSAHVEDIVAENLQILFCGINPSRYSGAIGHHFARPGNRFWKALYGAGLTDRLLTPDEDRQLLAFGIGITNLVARVTAAASELSKDEIREGATQLVGKLERLKPARLAVLGLGAYRLAFDRRAVLGRQRGDLGGASVWVLPNPSGLQAHYQLPELIECFRALRD